MSSVEGILEKEFMSCSNNNNTELDKTLINTETIIQEPKCITPVSVPVPMPMDFVSANTSSENQPANQPTIYKEFNDMGTLQGNNIANNDNNDNSNVSNSNTNNAIGVVDVGNERGGIVYDLLHILDDVYVYGRSVIENNYFNFADNDDFNLVYPNIYIGNYSVSTNLELMQSIGISHIISVIPTFNPPFPDKLKYLHIPAYDDESQDITQYFDKCNQFIANVLTEGGKVLIHCMAGRSRSVSIFLAFLINVIQGNFNQSILILDTDNDVSNEAEYKQISNDNIRKNNNNQTNIREFVNPLNNNNANNNKPVDNELKIDKVEYQKPQLNINNKYRTFMLYKKETMISEIEKIITKYKLLKKELDIYTNNDTTEDNIRGSIGDDVISNKAIATMKQKLSANLFDVIMKYVKKYRKIASPNSYFIEQLINIIY